MASPTRPEPTPNRAARRHPKPRAPIPRVYVTIGEACEYLGLSDKTIRRLIERGELTSYKYGAQIVRLKISELDDVFSRKAVGE